MDRISRERCAGVSSGLCRRGADRRRLEPDSGAPQIGAVAWDKRPGARQDFGHGQRFRREYGC